MGPVVRGLVHGCRYGAAHRRQLAAVDALGGVRAVVSDQQRDAAATGTIGFAVHEESALDLLPSDLR